MVNLKILENGSLRLEWDSDYDEDDREWLETLPPISRLHEVMESNIGNGWGVHFADELGQLSNAPVITEDHTFEDDGTIVISGKIWYFPNYMIVCPIAKLLENGHVDFDFWQEVDEWKINNGL